MDDEGKKKEIQDQIGEIKGSKNLGTIPGRGEK
jgi:hypothetical protein